MGDLNRWLVEYIIIHHSLTKDGLVPDWPSIDHYHTITNGWSDIGYHFGIEQIRKVNEYEVLVGRPMILTGAHCISKGFNYKSLGICMVGNFDKVTPPKQQWNRALKLTRSLMHVFEVPKFKVLGHHEVALDGRTCPGLLFNMNDFRVNL